MTTRFAASDLTSRLRSRLRGACAALSRRAGPPPVLAGLPPAAKALLRRILEVEGKSLRAQAVSGAAIALELRDVVAIYREPAPAGGGTFVFAINDWAVEQLRRYPEILADQGTVAR